MSAEVFKNIGNTLSSSVQQFSMVPEISVRALLKSKHFQG